MQVRDILNSKGSKVWTVRIGQTLQEALHLLSTHRIGALLVLGENNETVGILSERDILRNCYKHPTQWFQSRVHAVMTRDIHTVSLDTNLKVVMELMTEKRTRHILVMEDGKFAGIVSIGDIVKARLEQTEIENEQMRQYISGI